METICMIMHTVISTKIQNYTLYILMIKLTEGNKRKTKLLSKHLNES